jgi:hypothetical protein
MIKKVLILVVIGLVKVDRIERNKVAEISVAKLSAFSECIDVEHLKIISEERTLFSNECGSATTINIVDCGEETLKLPLIESVSIEICFGNLELFVKFLSFQSLLVSLVENEAFEELEEVCDYCEENKKNRLLAAGVFGTMIILAAGYIVYQRYF